MSIRDEDAVDDGWDDEAVDSEVVYEIEEADDPGEDADEAEERESRAEKKRKRGDNREREWAEERARLEARQAALEARLEAIQQSTQQVQNQNFPIPEPIAVLKKEFAELQAQQQNLADQWVKAQREGDKERLEQLKLAGQHIDELKAENISRRREVERELHSQQSRFESFRQQYPDIAGNQKALTWAQLRYNALALEEQDSGWKSDSQSRIREQVIMEAREKFLGGKRRDPLDDGTREKTRDRRFAGAATSPDDGPDRLKFDPRFAREQKQVIYKTFDYLPKEKAIQRFGQELKKRRLAEAKSRKRKG